MSSSNEKLTLPPYRKCDADKQEFGCEFVVIKRFRHLIFGFAPVNERVATIRIKTKFCNISLICGHAQTEEKNDEDIDVIYTNLMEIYRISETVIGREGIFGSTVSQFNIHTTTIISDIIQPISGNKVVCTTKLQYFCFHKATWLSPDHSTFNQIDHIVIGRRCVSNVVDVGTFRCPNIHIILSHPSFVYAHLVHRHVPFVNHNAINLVGC